MGELSAEQAYALVQGVLLGTIKTESRTTKSVLAAVPETNLDYRPDPCAKSANELLRHIAAADNFFLKSVIDGVFVPGSVTIGETARTPGQVAEWYEQAYAANFELIARLPGEHLIRMVDFRGLFQRPAYLFIQLGLLHTVHHRGQLSTYLRPMGSKVPAIYGESYDSAEAKKAAQA
ncbi:MAG TPA: DinB family protein [Candidatus Acidoferrum sp.]|nr:DinB family protein [Candidatus Acidoferrum sp.]